MVDPATIAMIRGGVLLGQIGISTVRELMAWMKESDIDLPALDEILASVEKSERAAMEATAALLNH